MEKVNQREFQVSEATITEEVKETMSSKLKRAISLDKQIKKRQAELKQLKEELQAEMGNYRVKTFSSDLGKLVYVAPTERTTVDTRLLKKELPDVANKYAKVVTVKASVRIKY
jgi:predicted phage-related endonuclease